MTMEERDRLIVVEQKLDHIIEKLDSFQKCHEDHENRIRCLESKPGKRWETVIAVVITAIITIGFNVLITFLK